MARPEWDERYQEGDLPWDTGVVERNLIEVVDRGVLTHGRILEVGCGTGTNALWLAKRGFDVIGLDLSPNAIARARSKLERGLSCRFEVLDFLNDEVPDRPFDAVFDRGCFHVFEEASEQLRFASRVRDVLAEEGRWISLIGSTEGAPRDTGPPRRTIREITAAIEPVLQIVEIRRTLFDKSDDEAAEAWLCIARTRREPAQPSTRWADR